MLAPGGWQKPHVLAIAFDIEGTFDHLWWPAVLKVLERRECAHALYGHINSYLREGRIVVEDNFETEEKRVDKGCPQGSILGPSLQNLMFNQLVIKLSIMSDQITSVAYSDEILILIEDRSRSEIEELAWNTTNNITS